MTEPKDPMDNVIRAAFGGEGNDIPAISDPTERILVVALLIGVAVVTAWPKDKPPPVVVGKAIKIGQQVWARRSWWLPAS